jgi:type I restriction enzyme S subunit
MPSLSEQIRIADVLSTIDDKIELNRRINDNLEQQAQTLFKSWFVDFEPFKDGEFVESELGMIPKGWKVGKLGELCHFKRGKNLLSRDSTKNC